MRFRTEREGRVAIRKRDGKHRREERHDLGQGEAHPRQAAFQLRDLVLARVLSRDEQALLQEIDHGVKRAVLVVGGAPAVEPRVCLVGEPLVEDLHES
jgi:hypothetical protein